MIEKCKKVYHFLEDEESKEIYINRLNFLISNEVKYIESIVNKYVPELRPRNVELYQDIENCSKTKPVIVWGCGNNVKIYYHQLLKIKNLKFFCDRNDSLQNNGFKEYKVISPEDLYRLYPDAIIVIGTTNYFTEIYDELIEHKYSPKDIFFLGNYVDMCSYKQYFEEEFIQFGKEEVFLDCGAYDLFNSKRLQELTGGKVVKSYAFEPDKQNYKNCLEMIKKQGLSYIELFPYAVWSHKDKLCFAANGNADSEISVSGKEVISAEAIDDIISDNTKVTFIKMDIEGAELDALHGAQKTIQRCHPKLAICIYHKPEDMYEIPLYIKEIVPDYRLFVRHYSNTTCETVLYAVM